MKMPVLVVYAEYNTKENEVSLDGEYMKRFGWFITALVILAISISVAYAQIAIQPTDTYVGIARNGQVTYHINDTKNAATMLGYQINIRNEIQSCFYIPVTQNVGQCSPAYEITTRYYIDYYNTQQMKIATEGPLPIVFEYYSSKLPTVIK